MKNFKNTKLETIASKFNKLSLKDDALKIIRGGNADIVIEHDVLGF